MKFKSYFVTFLMFFLIIGCAGQQPQEKASTQLQTRSYQTKNFDTQDSFLVMKALVNVLQDEGFIIKNVDKDLGFIVAIREAEKKSFIGGTLNILGGIVGSEESWEKDCDVEASANVSQFGEQIRVRVNFQMKLTHSFGGTVTKKNVDSPEFYQAFFSKLSKSIFLQQENI
ncbi:MAG: hypothetical protein K8R67_16605 [Desulfobacteraceae bacterium]|nr:hypothetical protein [Desulfobacteraceae bacterium]